MKLSLIRSSILAVAFVFSATASNAACGFLFVNSCHSGESSVSDGHAAALSSGESSATTTAVEASNDEPSKAKNKGKKGKKNKGKKGKKFSGKEMKISEPKQIDGPVSVEQLH